MSESAYTLAPSLPSNDPFRENVEILIRQRGNVLDSAITVRDLVDSGLLEVRADGTLNWTILQDK